MLQLLFSWASISTVLDSTPDRVLQFRLLILLLLCKQENKLSNFDVLTLYRSAIIEQHQVHSNHCTRSSDVV